MVYAPYPMGLAHRKFRARQMWPMLLPNQIYREERFCSLFSKGPAARKSVDLAAPLINAALVSIHSQMLWKTGSLSIALEKPCPTYLECVLFLQTMRATSRLRCTLLRRYEESRSDACELVAVKDCGRGTDSTQRASSKRGGGIPLIHRGSAQGQRCAFGGRNALAAERRARVAVCRRSAATAGSRSITARSSSRHSI